MKEITEIENYKVEIWRRAFQRRLNLTVKADGLVRVTCGRRISKREIARFVTESSPFIQERMLEFQSLRERFPTKTYVSDERFLFFGERWPLQVVWTWTSRVKIAALEQQLEMLAPITSTQSERQKAVRVFYKRQAVLHLKERVEFFSAKTGLFPKSISIRGQKTRWGSCSSEGVVCLNWKLLAAPLEVIDYVVIHELAHLRHLNHSPRFWALVEQFQPQWKQSRRWLKDHEYEIGIQF